MTSRGLVEAGGVQVVWSLHYFLVSGYLDINCCQCGGDCDTLIMMILSYYVVWQCWMMMSHIGPQDSDCDVTLCVSNVYLQLVGAGRWLRWPPLCSGRSGGMPPLLLLCWHPGDHCWHIVTWCSAASSSSSPTLAFSCHMASCLYSDP